MMNLCPLRGDFQFAGTLVCISVLKRGCNRKTVVCAALGACVLYFGKKISFRPVQVIATIPVAPSIPVRTPSVLFVLAVVIHYKTLKGNIRPGFVISRQSWSLFFILENESLEIGRKVSQIIPDRPHHSCNLAKGHSIPVRLPCKGRERGE